MGASSSNEPHWSTQSLVQEQQAGLQLLDSILETYRPVIDRDYQGYRNHCVRVYLYSVRVMPRPADSEGAAVLRKLAIALAFHDIGLWTARTIDYLDPSITVAMEYLEKNQLASWKPEISEMIDRHHQILQGDLPTASLANTLRIADLADFSWGWLRGPVPTAYINQIGCEAIL